MADTQELETQIATALIAIKHLPVGPYFMLNGGRVRRVRPMEYVLHADNNRDRARWGTLAEISDDVTFFITNGVLPKAQGGRW